MTVFQEQNPVSVIQSFCEFVIRGLLQLVLSVDTWGHTQETDHTNVTCAVRVLVRQAFSPHIWGHTLEKNCTGELCAAKVLALQAISPDTCEHTLRTNVMCAVRGLANHLPYVYIWGHTLRTNLTNVMCAVRGFVTFAVTKSAENYVRPPPTLVRSLLIGSIV